MIGFCSWREGLVLRPELARRVTSLGDVAPAGLRLVNREIGAEARSVLDRELDKLGIEAASLPGYDTQATGHLQVAAAIAAGLADAGIASEPAALPTAWHSSRWRQNGSTGLRPARRHPCRGPGYAVDEHVWDPPSRPGRMAA